MKTNCNIVQDLLPLYCDKACSEESKHIIDQHLQECEKCKKELILMQGDIKTETFKLNELQIAKAASLVWKKGTKTAFCKGLLITLLVVFLVVGTYTAYHLFSTVNESNHSSLAKQAAEYFKVDKLTVVQVEKKGNYLATLCKDENGIFCMCVFDRDDLFKKRWRAGGGIQYLKSGNIESWNYGSPQGESVLIFCGESIPDSAYWYKFQNNKITYVGPIENNILLNIFIIPNNNDINGNAILLDSNQQEIK